MALKLTMPEQDSVRGVLRLLRKRFGTWESLAKVLEMCKRTLQNVIWRAKNVTADLAFRVSRLVKAPMEDIIGGRWPAEGACPFCGHVDGKDPDLTLGLRLPRSADSFTSIRWRGEQVDRLHVQLTSDPDHRFEGEVHLPSLDLGDVRRGHPDDSREGCLGHAPKSS